MRRKKTRERCGRGEVSLFGEKDATTSTRQARVGAALLGDEIDPLLLGFKVSDPTFYRDYHAARIIIDRPGGHDGAKATANTTVVASPAAATPAPATA